MWARVQEGGRRWTEHHLAHSYKPGTLNFKKPSAHARKSGVISKGKQGALSSAIRKSLPNPAQAND